MRVLFSSTSGVGHVVPMLQLAVALRSGGHEVLWATAAQSLPLVTAAGIDAVAAGAHGAEEAALRGGVLGRAAELPGAERAAWVFPRMFGAALTPPMAEDLLGDRPGLGSGPPGPRAGRARSAPGGRGLALPSVTHSFGTAVPPEHLDGATALLAPLWRSHGLEVPPYAGCFRSGYLDIFPPSHAARGHRPHRAGAGHPARHRGRLFRGLQNPSCTSPWARSTTGPTCSARSWPGSPPCPPRHPCRCWWPSGPGVEPASLGEQPPHVRLESWVDQAAVLDRCTAVVSHGGSGTFLGALARGLPQLCVPQAADQFRNADAGLRAGAALVLRPDELSADAVASAVRELMEEPTVRARARVVAEEIAEMPSPEDVGRSLELRFG